jgi:hypothetical protein
VEGQRFSDIQKVLAKGADVDATDGSQIEKTALQLGIDVVENNSNFTFHSQMYT